MAFRDRKAFGTFEKRAQATLVEGECCHHCANHGLELMHNIYIYPSLKAELPGYLFLFPVGLVKIKGFRIVRVLVFPVTA